MTEKYAALAVYNLWSWLEANPDAGKQDYPLYDELRIKECMDMCPWCELFRIRFTRICSGCPLDRAYSNCFSDGSMFDCWNRNSRRSVAAGEIARIAWKEYKRVG